MRRSGVGEMLPNGLGLRMHGSVFGARSAFPTGRSWRAKRSKPALPRQMLSLFHLLVLGSSLVAATPSLLYTAGRKPGKSPPATVSGVAAAGSCLLRPALERRLARLYLDSLWLAQRAKCSSFGAGPRPHLTLVKLLVCAGTPRRISV